jgi:hypothetical protein
MLDILSTLILRRQRHVTKPRQMAADVSTEIIDENSPI